MWAKPLRPKVTVAIDNKVINPDANSEMQFRLGFYRKDVSSSAVGLILSFNAKGPLMVILARHTPQHVAVIGDVWHHGNIISMTSQLSDLSECL